MKYKLLSSLARPPEKRDEDSGYDLYALINSRTIEVIAPHTVAKINTGISIEMPIGMGGFLYSRSSYAAQGLIVVGGVIDSGYRGEIIVCLLNTADYVQCIGDGDKICQIIFHPVFCGTLKETEELSSSLRGEDGFGSTGG